MPSLYFLIRCRPHQRDLVISYLHNYIIMGLVRSTSDHMAWILLEDEDGAEEESWGYVLNKFHFSIKEYAEAFISHEGEVFKIIPQTKYMCQYDFIALIK